MSRHGPANVFGFMKRSRQAVEAADKYRLERVALVQNEKFQEQLKSRRLGQLLVVAGLLLVLELGAIVDLVLRHRLP